jgi:hypothetical protein
MCCKFEPRAQNKHHKKGGDMTSTSNEQTNIKGLINNTQARIFALILVFAAVATFLILQTSAASYTIETTGVRVRAAEGSGMVASRNYPGVFWWMRDGGPSTAEKPREAIYAMKFDTSGNLKPVRGSDNFPFNEIRNTSNNNWEDIALDEDNNIWIGDIGANNCGRNNQKLFRVKEPAPTSSEKLTIDASYTFKFPDPKSGCNTWNSEAMFWLDGTMYIFAKTYASPVYRVDFPSGNSGTAKLVKLGTLNGGVSNISVSSLSSDRSRLVVASHKVTNIFTTDKTWLRGDDLVKELINSDPTYTANFDCNCSASTTAVEGGAFRPGSYDIAFVAENKYTYYAKAADYGDTSTGNQQTEDTTPPSLSVNAPQQNETVSGTVTIEVDASDNVGIEAVDISHENGIIRYGTEQGNFGWGSQFDTRNISDGQHTITVTAFDNAGNQSVVERIINVNNTGGGEPAPEPDPTPPVSGGIIFDNSVDASNATASRWVSTTYTADASREHLFTLEWGNADANLRFDVREDSSGAWVGDNVSADRPKVLNAELKAGVKYRVGVWAEAGSTDFTVKVSSSNASSEDTQAPSVAITSPSSSQTVSGTIDINVSASDNDSIESVYIFYDKSGVVREGTSQGNLGWGSRLDTRNLSNGKHTIEVVASDPSGNVSVAKLTINVQN